MIHILIIWSNALEIKDYIINDLKSSFTVLKAIKVHWDKDSFLNNLIPFYAHSQRHLNESQYKELLKHKIQHCGSDDFYVVVFKDITPIMENRKTSSGYALVNANVFNKKEKYRILTGGGHKIHTSNDDWETNNDLTVLFGKNTNDFLKWIEEEDINYYNKNCVGVNGFDSISQLFYLLNNTIKYCVLRNHECLPDRFTIEGHGDIDLLVYNKNHAKYLTSAHDVYRIPYRVYHTISIAGQDIPFDFRYIGDNYYYEKWELEILIKRQLLPKGIYIPNDEDQFYTLLYHAYVQKRNVADDYIKKLSYYANRIYVRYDSTVNNSICLLDDFIRKRDYEYTKPNDKTVYYNLQSLQLSNYAFRHGKLISYNYQDESHQVPFFSVVYEKEQSYYKRASNFLIDNEVHFLKKFDKYNYCPKLLDHGVRDDGAYLETEKIEGVDFWTFFSSNKHLHFCFIKSFVEECITILRILTENNVIHRDFIGRNLLIKEEGNACKVSLIDFGWAIQKSEYNCCLKPFGLGNPFSPKEGYSDLYTFAMTLKKKWPNLNYVKNIYKRMETNVYCGEDDSQECYQIFNDVECLLKKKVDVIDHYLIFEMRHEQIHSLRRKLYKK